MEKIIIGNLKMNLLSVVEREQYLKLLKKELAGKKIKNFPIVLCPPAIHLEAFSKLKRKNVFFGAQNVFWKRSGSFTGEISPSMIKNMGAQFVILGHSERRKYFGEKDEEINQKISSVLRNGLIPIVCGGDTALEKEKGQTFRIISAQLKKAMQRINRTKLNQIIIAYEPVWAVGSDIIPSANEIMQVKILIKKILVEIFEKKYADETKIIYGGSVNSKTAKETCLDSGMDGVLVGRESLIPFEFLKIGQIINS